MDEIGDHEDAVSAAAEPFTGGNGGLERVRGQVEHQQSVASANDLVSAALSVRALCLVPCALLVLTHALRAGSIADRSCILATSRI